MSAPAAAAPLAPSLPSASRRLDGAGVQLGVFAAMSLYVSMEYAGLLAHPPRLHVLAIVAVITAGCGCLGATGRLPAGFRAALRTLLLAATVVLAVLLAGVPAHLLSPDGWPALARHVGHGVSALGSWLWPYRGDDQWARRAVLLVLPAALLAAGALCFWPAERAAEARRALALLLLLALYLAAVANTPAHLDGLRGLVLLTFVAAWLWLPGLRLAQAPRAARWLLVCALVALLLRPVLSSSSSWIDYRETNAAGAETASFQWDQLYGPIPWSRSAATMFEIASRRPVLLRVTSLDRFDGLRFLRSADPPGSRRLDEPSRHLRQWLQSSTTSVAGLRSNLLVAGGGVPVSAQWLGRGSPALRRQADGTLVVPLLVGAGALYKVSSYEPRATPAQLRAAPRSFPRAYLPYAQLELPGRSASGLSHPNLLAEERRHPAASTVVGPSRPGLAPGADPATAARLAASPYGPMFALAQRLAAGAPSSYDVAKRIQSYLLGGYRYSEQVGRARYPLEAFLFSQRAGYCQQFSGAMTLMLRMLGIPARVGAGFKPVLYDSRTGAWRVRALDAHAWVEVFFRGIGWVTFDPTPNAPVASPEAEGARNKGLIQGGSATSAHHLAKLSQAAGAAARPAGSGGSSPLPFVLGALGLLMLGACARAWVIGRRRLRRALAGEADGAVAELERALAALAGRRGPSLGSPVGRRGASAGLADGTLTSLALELREQRRDQAAAYVEALVRSRYERPGTGERPSLRGRAALRRALAALGGGPSLLGRTRALAAMPPGVARREGAPGRAPSRRVEARPAV